MFYKLVLATIVSHPGGFAVKYEYDNGFLKYIKKASDNAVIWQCNSTNEYGNITDYDLSAGNINVKKSYNSNGYLTQIKTSAGSTARQWLRYSFDASTGDLAWRRDSIRNITENFRYDDFDQLEWMEVSGLDSISITYDDIGNITFKSDVGNYYYNPTRIHAIDSISDSQFQNRQDIEYNFFNKPVYIADEEDSLNYTYNVLDNRIKATLYGTGGLVKTTWYAGLYEKTVENSITKHYYYINSPDGPVALAIQTGGGTPEFYYLCKDHLGSITGVMNSSGTIVEEYNFDAWGRRRNPTDWSYSNVATPTYTQHGFTGHEHLDMFNLINMNGRVYDSEIARFLSPDPIIQNPYNLLSYNRYSYCLNNPLKYIDPSGYSYQRFMEIFEEEQRDNQPSVLYNNYPSGWEQTVHNYNTVIGPAMGLNGAGSNGIYYDWYTGDFKSTVTRGDVDYMPYGVGIDWMTISYLLSNPANIHIGMVYFTDGSKADWNLWINSDLPASGGGNDFVNTANNVNTGIGVGTGVLGGNYGLTANQTFRYAQRINGRVVSAAELTAAHAAQSMKVANALGRINLVTGVLGSAYSTGKAISDYNNGGWQNVNGLDVTDAAVGWGGVGVGVLATFGMVSNPVGWCIGIGTGLYFGARLIYDLSKD